MNLKIFLMWNVYLENQKELNHKFDINEIFIGSSIFSFLYGVLFKTIFKKIFI